jgi:thiamine-phosphate pyrophosphorylase
MKPIDQCRLYTFVDSAYLHGREPSAICRALCEGGSHLIQLRAKDWPAEHIAETAAELRAITREYNVGFVVNDHPEIAREVGADLCHLGQEDFFDAGHAHTSEFSGLKMGLSTHAPDQAAQALAADPAYVAIGPIYPTGTKPGARPVTLEYVRWASANVRIPWFAIGGVNLRTLPDVISAGATRVCVVSAILNAADVAGECRKYAVQLLQPGS